MNKPPTPCLFCGQPGDMSKQHVFPDRLKHLMPRGNGSRLHVKWDTVRRNKKTVHDERTVKPSQGSPGNHRIRKVCATCNNGWLKKMEEDCFPLVERMMRLEVRVIEPGDQIKLSRIAMSIALVGEWLSKAHVTTTQAERDFYRRKLTPPPNWYVFLGRDGTYADQPRFLTGGAVSSDGDVSKAPKVYSSFTMTMTPVLLHVIAFGGDTIEFFDVDRYAEHLGLASIYPPTDWISFERMPQLTIDEIASVRSYAGESLRGFVEQ